MKNVILTPNPGSSSCSTIHGQWPPNFHIKFRNTENLLPYLENIPKKQFSSASLKKQFQLKNVRLTPNRGSSSCSTCLKKQEQIPLKKQLQ